jgi:disulfide bond formation protein DsbB
MMFPLPILIVVALLRKIKDLPFLVLPLTLIGTAIAVYHNLLYYEILPESAAPCQLGISCTSKTIEWFGFVTIPFLSLSAFLLISSAMLYILWKNNQK